LDGATSLSGDLFDFGVAQAGAGFVEEGGEGLAVADFEAEEEVDGHLEFFGADFAGVEAIGEFLEVVKEVRVGEDVGDFAELRRGGDGLGIAIAVVVEAAVVVSVAGVGVGGRAAAVSVRTDVRALLDLGQNRHVFSSPGGGYHPPHIDMYMSLASGISDLRQEISGICLDFIVNTLALRYSLCISSKQMVGVGAV
jgi:hypothetical protein